MANDGGAIREESFPTSTDVDGSRGERYEYKASDITTLNEEKTHKTVSRINR
jgi:hypothetical protein